MLVEFSVKNFMSIKNEITFSMVAGTGDENKDNIIENKIVIHITGEVEEEGVIELEKGARISDAIEEAGGTTEEADLSNVNLAYSLSDGQKVKIPNINEKDEEIIVVEEKAGDNIIIEGNKSNRKKVRYRKNRTCLSGISSDLIPGDCI